MHDTADWNVHDHRMQACHAVAARHQQRAPDLTAVPVKEAIE